MGGLNRFDMKTERFTHYACSSGEAASYKSSIVCDIVPYQDDLLLATHDGVYRFKPSDGSCMPMFKSGKEGYVIGLALDLHLDTQGVLWIAGTEKGVYAYDFKKENLLLHTHEAERSASLSSNGVNCLYEDSQNRLWVCMAESGVDLYQTETNGFENYSEENKGLLSNCVYGAYETGDDKLLFITDNGFAYFDYKTKQFRNFKANISLPLAGINQKSIYRASNGRIYIGGVDGLISFYPEELEEMTSEYQIFPSELYVNDRLIEVGDETGILENSLSDTRKITIDYEQNMFSLRYSVTNYVPLIQEEIVYKLENFSEEWSTLRNGRMITYTNLNPGTYTLIVKSDSGVEGTKQISRLEIEVLPPWFRTYWAYMGYLLVLIALLYIVMRFYKNRVKLQAELEYERKRIKDVENLNQYKLRFFTNISHEFRTPLTIIIGQMELLLQIKSFVPAVYNRMLNVYKSCVQLQSLVTELLDFRKQEQGHMKIKVSPHNIVAFLKENYLLFLEYAQTKEIEFKFEAEEEDIEVWYDSKQMQKVVNNLLSNAFQYTPKGGAITLIVKKDEESVEVSVVDTGKGIKKSEISYIFDRFYQSEATLISSGKGTGIGLALTKGIVELHGGNISVDSEEGKGSVFTFRIPLGKMHFKTEEIVEEGADTTVVTATNEKQREDVILMEEEEQQMPEEISGNKTHKILVVEDEDGLRNMLVEIFSPYYIVEQASDGKEGLDKVVELQPDIVLSDVLMPTMSGIELCKQIKSNVDTCHIPVVLLTARTAIEHKLEGLQYGADDYIVKPFDLNILLARCRNLVNGRILLQEKFSKQPQTTAQLFATNPLDKIFMDKAMAIVENNLDNVDFNVNMFAQEMTIARTKLFVKLKAITGQTPNDFILTVRMKKAAFMLKSQPELNISEISDKAGFNSPRYFSRVFKERYNMTPQAYRKQAGQGDVELDSEDNETD
jgi:signal transduction histidine kinase/DNA-binding response OmpR family regulator